MEERNKNDAEFVKELQELRDKYKKLKLKYDNDIYKLKQDKIALAEREAKYRSMFDRNPQPNWIYDSETLSILEANDAAINHYGYSKEELLSMTLRDILLEEDIQNLYLTEIQSNSQNELKVQKHIKKNGEFIFVEVVSHPVYLNNCNLIHSTIHDITARRQTENELFESEMNFRRSISESPVGIRIVAMDGITVYVNRALLDIYELNSLEEFKNMSALSRYTVDSYIQHLDRKKKRKKGQEVFEYEISFKCKNDEIRQVKVSKKEVLWDGIKHFQVITQDITEQRNAEEKLRIYSRVVEQSTNSICITNPAGVIEYVNPRTIEMTGYNEDELIGMHTRIFRSGKRPKDDYAQLWKTIKAGDVWSGEFHNKRKNGELYWESVTISPVFNSRNEITHFFSIKVDISAYKKILQDLIVAKERAEESEIFLRTFIENIPFDIWASEVDSLGIQENMIRVDYYGSIMDKIIKSNALINRKNIQAWEGNIKRVMNGEIIDVECEYIINQQQNIFQQIAFPIYKKNDIIGIAGMNINITDRKFAEIALINSEEQLRKFASHLQNVREEERSALAREIHDDLGQILVALKIDIGLLKQKILKNEAFVMSVDILSRFDNLSSLIDNTIKTARRIMNGLRPEQLELLGLEVAIKEYLRDFENRHQLDCQFRSTISELEINHQQTLVYFRILQEAMTNIVKHAKATNVIVELGSFQNILYMEITDNGVGFDIKNSGRNDSYGMIGMKERVFILKGELTITSKVGEGTKVRVEIPYVSRTDN
jgi:PAS domain S-box-containing protein